ncbi:MAG: hypothetical protein KDB80_17805, partial [Planctomycetes bacterium]|nr:hypothetical protein [Planctomycetota bacterium]
MRLHSHPVLAALLWTSLPVLVPAQGASVNFEVHPVKPMAVTQVDGRTWLAVCNTSDNSVEFYDAATLTFEQRVPVGLRPVSITWHQGSRSFYTANFLGDSISRIELVRPPGSNGTRAVLDRTMPTGDEPTDVIVASDDRTVMVTLQSTSSMAWHEIGTLELLKGPASGRITLGSSLFDPQAPFALKHPRRILEIDGKLVVMGQRGGNSPAYDFDLLTVDLATLQETNVDGLGSTNWNITPGPDGRVFVVGGFARNDVAGVQALAALPTGFVRSELYVIDDLGEPSWIARTRDLNRDEFGAVEPPDVAIDTPTDVALLTLGQTVTKVFVTGFGSDRIEVLHPTSDAPADWPSTYIDVPNTSPEHSRTGPRALLVVPAGPSSLTAPRLLCYNALNKSISVIDAASESVVMTVSLQHDPTESVVHRGREFLYSGEHSGSGFVSCSTCHVDGTTDGLGWNLGTIGGGPAGPIPPHLIDGIVGPPEFSSDKGIMITQSLQGLVDHPVDLPETQYLFSNAPYHWRGDKPRFNDFNEAFVNLQGKPDIGSPGDPQGITPQQMNAYVSFINTIMYPPNPEESPDRRYTGELGALSDVEDGTGAIRGMKLFHTFPLAGGLLGNRACVQCHWLPEGSNNRITEVLGQPIETAATRGLFQREARNEIGATTLSQQVTGEFGLLHPGNATSLNSFVFLFDGVFGDPLKTVDVMRFMREYDWGTAPLVGKAFTIDVSNVAAPSTAAALDLFEDQAARANAGVAALVRTNGLELGLYFDVGERNGRWRQVGTNRWIDRNAMLALCDDDDDRIVVQATEVGAERRYADPSGAAPTLTGPNPSDLTLEPMRPSTQWREVPRLTKNWVPGTGPNEFDWAGNGPNPKSIRTIRIYQHALIDKAPQFGLTAFRHEAPRRFRIAGRDIRHGAFLILTIAADATTPPPYVPGDGHAVQIVATELFPTSEFTADGRRIWETTLEADPLVQYLLMLGGPFAPDTVAAFFDNVPEPPLPSQFDPVT